MGPLSDNARRRKKRNKDKILTLDSGLRGNLSCRAGRDSVESPSIYAHVGTHQFDALKGAFGTTSRGGPVPRGDIPKRPFLGLSGGSHRNRVTDAGLPRRGHEVTATVIQNDAREEPGRIADVLK